MNKKQIADALKELLAKASSSYYNTDKYLKVKVSGLPEEVADYLLNAYVTKGKVGMYEPINVRTFEFTDEEFDRVERVVQTLDPSWVKPVGAAVKNEKLKETLPIPIFSLNKVHGSDSSIPKFSAKYKGPYVVSDKLDGNSLEIVYENGKPTAAYTRGDAYVGGNVSYLIPHMSIPKTITVKHRLVIRFEAVMPESDFKKWASKYKNARNLTSGIFNKKSAHEALGDIHVIAHSLLEPHSKSPSDSFAFLATLGFDVVWHSKVQQITGSSLSTLFKQRTSKSRYKIDGLVVVQDKPHAFVEGNPPYAVAFKEASEENFAETKVLGIEWNASKHGYLIPTVLVQPVDLEGVTVSRATGFNAKYILDNKIGKGAIVSLIRSGDVIPDIQEVIKPALKPDLPNTAYFGDYSLNKSGVHFVMHDTSKHDDVKIKAWHAFIADGLDIENVGQGTIARLYDAGFDSLDKILNATVEDFMEADGVQQRKAQNIYNSIQTKLHNADLVKVAANSGFFGRNVGDRKLAVVEEQLGLRSLAKLKPAVIESKIAELHGFTKVTAAPIADNLARFFKWVDTLPLRFVAPKKLKVTGSKFKDQVVVFTGFRNADWEQLIKAQGGKIGSGVNKTTTLVVAANPSEGHGKLQKANELGITVIGKTQFERKYVI